MCIVVIHFLFALFVLWGACVVFFSLEMSLLHADTTILYYTTSEHWRSEYGIKLTRDFHINKEIKTRGMCDSVSLSFFASIPPWILYFLRHLCLSCMFVVVQNGAHETNQFDWKRLSLFVFTGVNDTLSPGQLLYVHTYSHNIHVTRNYSFILEQR